MQRKSFLITGILGLFGSLFAKKKEYVPLLARDPSEYELVKELTVRNVLDEARKWDKQQNKYIPDRMCTEYRESNISERHFMFKQIEKYKDGRVFVFYGIQDDNKGIITPTSKEQYNKYLKHHF